MNPFRAALVLAAGAIFGVWIYTGASLDARNQAFREGSVALAERYVNAQESLATIRTMVLLTSVRVRDAVLVPETGAMFEDRRQIEAAYRLIVTSLEDYEPVAGPQAVEGLVGRLVSEIEQLHSASLAALEERPAAGRAIRDLLNGRIIPMRDAALATADQIQAQNRQAFIAQSAETASREAADARWRQQLGLGLLAGLAAMLLSSLYTSRFQGRWRYANTATS